MAPLFEELDMGMIEDEERQFMLVDKDTGKVYDLRNANHLSRLEDRQMARLTTDTDSHRPVSLNINSQQQAAWSDWWRNKRRNNQDFLIAAENGDLALIRRLLDPTVYQDLTADVNTKGLDQWTALHFAANEGRVEIVRALLQLPEVVLDARSSIQRTALHLACMRGYTLIARELLDKGADKNVKDFD